MNAPAYATIKVIEALQVIQTQLKAPKGQYNKFGKYKYRSCEDIMEALKPLLCANACALVVEDEIEEFGERFYIKATATLWHADQRISATAYAREPLDKKGMDSSQITGAASSYARKYALNGLFLIDDTVDADGSNDHAQPKNIATDDFKAMCRELWKEIATYTDGDQILSRLKHKHGDDFKGLYTELSETLRILSEEKPNE